MSKVFLNPQNASMSRGQTESLFSPSATLYIYFFSFQLTKSKTEIRKHFRRFRIFGLLMKTRSRRKKGERMFILKYSFWELNDSKSYLIKRFVTLDFGASEKAKTFLLKNRFFSFLSDRDIASFAELISTHEQQSQQKTTRIFLLSSCPSSIIYFILIHFCFSATQL